MNQRGSIQAVDGIAKSITDSRKITAENAKEPACRLPIDVVQDLLVKKYLISASKLNLRASCTFFMKNIPLKDIEQALEEQRIPYNFQRLCQQEQNLVDAFKQEIIVTDWSNWNHRHREFFSVMVDAEIKYCDFKFPIAEIIGERTASNTKLMNTIQMIMSYKCDDKVGFIQTSNYVERVAYIRTYGDVVLDYNTISQTPDYNNFPFIAFAGKLSDPKFENSLRVCLQNIPKAALIRPIPLKRLVMIDIGSVSDTTIKKFNALKSSVKKHFGNSVLCCRYHSKNYAEVKELITYVVGLQLRDVVKEMMRKKSQKCLVM